MKKLLLHSIVLLFSTSLLAQPVYVNGDDYINIDMGMTLEQVEEVLGVEGTLDTTVIYIWPDNNLQAEWTDGKLSSFQSYSPMFEGENGYELLKEACAGPDGPMSNYLSFEEVVELLGTEGEKPDWFRYIWWVDEYQKIKVSFRDGKAFESSKF
ncbi:MAG: hypothetical protein DRQ13_09575 [Ignavibacteriae bacterium]|nr:MAG: hypothetical protein DRQ13_09575 [Ignavibacteriota bacterium]